MAGFDNEVVYADNVDFSGGFPVTAKVTSDGQLLIGSTATPNIRVGNLSSSNGSLTITNGAGTIDIQANGGAIGQTLTGNSGGARSPSGGNWNIVTANATVKIVGSGSTLTEDFGLTNLILGSSSTSITTGTANTGLGLDALNAVAGGTSNVCIGYQTGDNINSGNENVLVGRNAGGTIAGGGQNVCLGHSAGATITSGSSNVLIGKTAGNSFTGAASNNICIGEGVSGSGAVSNSIRIGSTHTTTFIDGIESVTVSASAPVAVDANNQLSSLGYGTATNILTSNGAGSSPTWQAPATFSQVVMTVFTADGTYTPTTGMKYCIIECVGGGGGGGGAQGNVAQAAAGSGGGGGAYLRGAFSAATIGASKAVTIGAGGTAGANTGGAGGAGGTTSVGTLVQAAGGAAGSGAASAASGFLLGGLGAAGGLVAGQFTSAGGSGGSSIWTTTGGFCLAGSGGGGGASGGNNQFRGAVTATQTAGINGSTFGGGGSGGISYLNATGSAGGTGTQGYAVITEYI